MQRSLILVLAGLLATVAFGAAGVDVSTDFVSEYVFRGVTMRQGASLQPSVAYSFLDTGRATVWTNLRLENSVSLSETDYSLQWTGVTRSPAAFTLGAVYYDRARRHPLPKTAELFAGVDFQVPGSPAVYAWYDCDRRTGFYWELSASHRFLLPDYRGTFDLSASLGFDTGRLNGFQDARLSFGVTRQVGEWRLRPSLDLHFPSSDADRGAHSFRPVFRLTASRSF